MYPDGGGTARHDAKKELIATEIIASEASIKYAEPIAIEARWRKRESSQGKGNMKRRSFKSSLLAVVLAGCVTTPPYVPPPSDQKTVAFSTVLEGSGAAGIQICDGNTGWKLVGEVGDGRSFHEQFFINYRVPPRSFNQVLPAGRRIKLAGAFSSTSGDPGAGYRVVSSSRCVAVVSLIPDPDYAYDAVWKMDDTSCSLMVYRLVKVDEVMKRMIEPTLQRSDEVCH